MTTPEEVTKALEAVLAKIRVGWCQCVGKRIDDEGKVYYCLMEALSTVAREYTKVPDMLGALMDSIRHANGGLNPSLGWNDAAERTKTDVEKVLRNAIEFEKRKVIVSAKRMR